MSGQSGSRFRTHYENLQIAENASDEVVKGAYKYLSQKHHPDRNPQNRDAAERITKIINEAYAVLSDPEKRKQHDAWIKEQRMTQARTVGPPPVLPKTPVEPQDTALPPLGQGVVNGTGFFNRAWLMLLFVAALVMLLGVVPYQVIIGHWQWSYLAAVCFWLYVGQYSYRSLFSPRVVAEEQGQEKERRLAIKPNTLKGLIVGGVAGLVAFALFALLLANDPKSQFSFDLFAFGFFVIAGALIGALRLRR